MNLSLRLYPGLKYIYEMTKDETTELRLDLEKSGGQRGYAVYQSFSLSGPSKYNLKIGTYNGTVAGNMIVFGKCNQCFNCSIKAI